MINSNVEVVLNEIENKKFLPGKIISKVEGYLNNNFILSDIEKDSSKIVLTKVEKMLERAYYWDLDIIFNMIISGYYFDYNKVTFTTKFDSSCPNNEYILEYDITNLVLDNISEIEMSDKSSSFMTYVYKLLSDNSYRDKYISDINKIENHFRETLPLLINKICLDRLIIGEITMFRIRMNSLSCSHIIGNIKMAVKKLLSLPHELAESIDRNLLYDVVVPLVDIITDIITGSIYKIYYSIPNMFDNLYGYSMYRINIDFKDIDTNKEMDGHE